MTRITISAILTVLSLLLSTSCQDDIGYFSGEIPEGESVVQFKLNFKDFTPTLESRSAGDAIKSINKLWIVIYNSEDGSLFLKRNVTGDFTIKSNTRPDGKPQAETETGHAEFRTKLPNGRYRIYAVANMDIADLDVTTEDNLRSLQAEWIQDNVQENSEMFGWFSNTDNDIPNHGFEAEEVIVAPGKTSIHAWLYRLASKVTVAFDGSGLKEGVSIYVKKLRIKNIPRSCYLGKDNKAENESNLYKTGEEVEYSSSTAYDSSHETLISKDIPFYPRKQEIGDDGKITWIKDPDSHSETNPNSLFFYENMQGKGPDKRQSDIDNNGILDELYPYDTMSEATYIEVETHYVSTNPQRPGVCDITYRFMLGQDITTDYNARRNCHYKLTLHLNGFADEPDWRIDYVTRLNVSEPRPVNYQGKYFQPDGETANQGNTFINENYIHVESFMFVNDSWEKHEKVPFDVEFRDKDSKEFSSAPPEWWLGEITQYDKGNGTVDLKIEYKNPFTEVDINKTLIDRDTKPGIYDLATKGGTENINSANCYIVDSKGTYQIPLIYGNAVVNGNDNKSSYTYQGSLGTPNPTLATFKNYKDQGIQKPYILEDIYGNADNIPSGLGAKLVWQDIQNLVTDIKYIKTEYNGLGAIRFTVGDQIKEGNAVIALTAPDQTVMWSWHIWVTAIDLSKKITITNYDGTTPKDQFDIMPVNLGWCSGGTKIRYYERHECEVRITQRISSGKGVSQIVKIIQEPHISLPRGNNPYFQWGRKDPFVAAGNGNKTNKTRYTSSETLTSNPERMYAAGQDTISTIDATAALIRNPHKWQNCHRKATGAAPGTGPTHVPIDNIYLNLWDNSNWDGDNIVVKTVYDPCPAPYHVGSVFMFTGFVNGASYNNGYFTGNETPGADGTKFLGSSFLYAVTDENNTDVPDDYKTGIFEFYADRDTKLISIGFPQNGYRDWADDANILSFDIGNIWLAQSPPVSWGNSGYTAYDMEFFRNTTNFDLSRVWTWDNFNATDGFAVRPTITR